MGNCCSTEATATIPHAPAADKPLAADPAPAAAPRPDAPESPRGADEAPPPAAADGPDQSPASAAAGEDEGGGGSGRVQTPTRAAGAAFSPVDAPGATHAVRMGGYTLRYSYYSKRGFYPEARKKPNQDSYYCETHFAGDEAKAFFAVFDGHGQVGDVCSQFAAEQLPDLIVRGLEQGAGVLPALAKAHVETNEAMHEASFDDSMSGTTSISVLFCGDEVYVSNVGDSRAIIAQENLKASTIAGEANLVAKPLSIDQTPFRKDERERVKKCGARILTVDQVEGLEPIHENWGLTLGEEIDMNGDPPRIWHPYGQYPGTAFTRSIGDLVSEELGVTADPEILCKGLKPHDKFIVVASDGVFEFLTSQNVVDIVKKFDDPSEACRALVEEAYNRWLQFEVRTDDITAICIFLDGLNGNNHDGPRESIFLGREVLAFQSMQRPVRGSQKSARRDTIVGTDAIRLSITDAMVDLDDKLPPSDSGSNDERSEEEIEWIKDIVHENFLFNHLSEEKIRSVISVLKKEEVKAGEVVIRQGSPGDTFYLVESGEFEVRQLPDEHAGDAPTANSAQALDDYGELIHVYKASEQLHPTFGELALIYSKPRAATVVATTDGSLLSLNRLAFRSILMRGRPLRDVVSRLRQISLLRPLTVAQTNLVAEEMKSITFAADQVILHEGMTEPGFFLIISGRIEASAKSDTVAPLELKTFDYFGEISLVRRRSISQRTLRASEKTECLFIKRDTLEQAVGKLSSVMEKDKIRRTRKDRIAEARKRASAKALVLFDSEPPAGKLPKTVSQFEVVGDVFYDPINTIRLVKVKGTSPGTYMTLRSVSKQAVFDASMQKHVCGERDIYVALYEKNALVPNVYGMNTNDTDIHLLYDAQIVGNLEEFLGREPHGESFVRYYAAQVVMALEFLHSEGIVSRTADPTNLLVDRSGNIRMLNLRLSKYVGRGRTYTVCGTPEYLSPEQIQGEGHNIAADYWALGVLMYELLCGVTPFSQDKKGDIEILNLIASFTPDQLHWPETASPEIKDLVSRLLCPEYPRRLGFSVSGSRASFSRNGCEAIKKHAFFAGTSWEATKSGSFAAPLEVEASARFREILADKSHQELNIGAKYSGDFEWLSGF